MSTSKEVLEGKVQDVQNGLEDFKESVDFVDDNYRDVASRVARLMELQIEMDGLLSEVGNSVRVAAEEAPNSVEAIKKVQQAAKSAGLKVSNNDEAHGADARITSLVPRAETYRDKVIASQTAFEAMHAHFRTFVELSLTSEQPWYPGIASIAATAEGLRGDTNIAITHTAAYREQL